MSEPDRQATDRDLADYYDHAGTRTDDWDELTPVDKPERLNVTLSVRFTATEVATVRARAAEAGLKPTTYIRQCALTADQPPVDRARLARSVDALARDLDDLRYAAG